MEPSLVAGKDEREPRNPPSGVRATPTIHTSVHKRKMRQLDYICQKYKKMAR